jgi:hypothetical protein
VTRPGNSQVRRLTVDGCSWEIVIVRSVPRTAKGARSR